MKSFILAMGIALIASTAQAQQTKLITRTITAVDTATFTNVPGKVKSFQYSFTKTSGTAAGLVILEATINGTWFGIDTLTLSNVTTPQTIKYTLSNCSGTSFLSYRFRNTNTSSATGEVRAAWLRRTDE